ncbi:MAG: hypothetical protein ACPG8W_26090 [Candidatus Promineifilaceae bacterium]
MQRPIPTALINTFIFATVLKMIGISVAMLTAYSTSRTLAIDRWGGGMLTGFLLLIVIIPWGQWFGRRNTFPHAQLLTALVLAILMQYLDVIISS